jgi:peroxin-19
MKQFENLGGDEMIDGMMQQLLTKDLMYEPIKEVTAKFPKWLDDNRQVLSDEEYAK